LFQILENTTQRFSKTELRWLQQNFADYRLGVVTTLNFPLKY